jgi:hypothetical protein
MHWAGWLAAVDSPSQGHKARPCGNSLMQMHKVRAACDAECQVPWRLAYNNPPSSAAACHRSIARHRSHRGGPSAPGPAPGTADLGKRLPAAGLLRISRARVARGAQGGNQLSRAGQWQVAAARTGWPPQLRESSRLGWQQSQDAQVTFDKRYHHSTTTTATTAATTLTTHHTPPENIAHNPPCQALDSPPTPPPTPD